MMRKERKKQKRKPGVELGREQGLGSQYTFLWNRICVLSNGKTN